MGGRNAGLETVSRKGPPATPTEMNWLLSGSNMPYGVNLRLAGPRKICVPPRQSPTTPKAQSRYRTGLTQSIAGIPGRERHRRPRDHRPAHYRGPGGQQAEAAQEPDQRVILQRKQRNEHK